MIYLDANVVISSITHVADQSEEVARLLRSPQTFYISRLADYEVRKYLAGIQSTDGQENLNLLLAGKFNLGNEWEAAILQALKISRQFKSRLWVDSADTLHVGWALSIGADVFASFDRMSGPRALALCVGLKLWPQPMQMDFAAMKRLKR